MRGLLIVFEGLDRSGKSTQSKLLIESLSNSELIRFPNRDSLTGKQIATYLEGKHQLCDEAIHLLFSANRWEMKQFIKKTYMINALNQGKNIVLDRYVYSGVAYSSAKGLDLNWCLSSDKGLPQPDIVFYIYVDENKIGERAGFGEERYENMSFQQKVKQQYQKLIQKDWVQINGNQTIEQIHSEIKQIVDDFKLNKQDLDLI